MGKLPNIETDFQHAGLHLQKDEYEEKEEEAEEYDDDDDDLRMLMAMETLGIT